MTVVLFLVMMSSPYDKLYSFFVNKMHSVILNYDIMYVTVISNYDIHVVMGHAVICHYNLMVDYVTIANYEFMM